ncbi:MAG: hypothetical protein V4773_17905 [Verrucomicrobiota bacterium]
MNLLRKTIHRVMEGTGLDRHVNHFAVNAWLEQRRARHYPTVPGAEANHWIGQLIANKQPAALGKIGDRECCALAAHLKLRQFYKYTWAAPSYGEADLHQQAGVFPPTTEMYSRFSELYLDRLRDLDGCAVWNNIGESEILRRYSPRVRRIELRALEPYFFSAPWSAELAGKRVLVIHPFEQSIRSQYERRAEIWPAAPGVLPDFELETIRSPYGFGATDFTDWIEMLHWLERRIEEVHRRAPIDVALIGCGAASVPLTAFVKKLGAIGIHTGGPTQIFFGIRGGRWDKLPEFQPFFNAAWIRALSSETPVAAKKVDKGGYW